MLIGMYIIIALAFVSLAQLFLSFVADHEQYVYPDDAAENSGGLYAFLNPKLRDWVVYSVEEAF